MALMLFETASEKKNQGTNPHISQSTKGVPSSVGLDLKPIPKINHITVIKRAGLITAQAIPK